MATKSNSTEFKQSITLLPPFYMYIFRFTYKTGSYLCIQKEKV